MRPWLLALWLWQAAVDFPSCTEASQSSETINADDVLATRQQIDILESFISYVDTGAVGETENTVVFLHGNPTAAYLWRKVIPRVASTARCLAPDFLGMGRSGKVNGLNYTFAEQYHYFSSWVEAMDLPDKFVMVVHDWGSGIGLHWCNEHRQRVKAIVFMESMMTFPATWDDLPEDQSATFQALRTDAGEELVLEQNIFIERTLPSGMFHNLTAEEWAEYRLPFEEEGESRRPMLTFARSFPVASAGPQEVVDVVTAYAAWMGESEGLPKLYVDADPGLSSPSVRQVVADWPDLETIQVVAKHFLQEDAPEEIGEGIARFLQSKVYDSPADGIKPSLTLSCVLVVVTLFC